MLTPASLPVAARSVLLNGVSETNTETLASRSWQQSARVHSATPVSGCDDPRSTCHQGAEVAVAGSVWLVEPIENWPSRLPSTARSATPPKSVLD